MIIPTPAPGLVVRYSYLWHGEQRDGREEGQKDRPSAIVAAVTRAANDTRVLVLPITHRQPSDDTIEIPASIKEALGLDVSRSWIVLSEWNEFVWPGPDLRAVPGRNPSTCAYGFLPPGFYGVVRERFLGLALSKRGRSVPRSE